MVICVLFRSGYPNTLLTAGLLRTSLKTPVPESAEDLSFILEYMCLSKASRGLAASCSTYPISMV